MADIQDEADILRPSQAGALILHTALDPTWGALDQDNCTPEDRIRQDQALNVEEGGIHHLWEDRNLELTVIKTKTK